MKASCKTALLLFSAILFVVLLGQNKVDATVQCDVKQLLACKDFLSTGNAPAKNSECCKKLNQQKPCLCTFLKNPSWKATLTSPNAKKIGNACGVRAPKC